MNSVPLSLIIAMMVMLSLDLSGEVLDGLLSLTLQLEEVDPSIS